MYLASQKLTTEYFTYVLGKPETYQGVLYFCTYQARNSPGSTLLLYLASQKLTMEYSSSALGKLAFLSHLLIHRHGLMDYLQD